MEIGSMVAFVLEPEVIDRLRAMPRLGAGLLRSLAADGQLTAYHHTGWQPMDTLRIAFI